MIEKLGERFAVASLRDRGHEGREFGMRRQSAALKCKFPPRLSTSGANLSIRGSPYCLA